MANFNYNQLNVVGRDKDSVVLYRNVLTKELTNLKDKVSPESAAFKKVVQVANEVWSGDDKDLFIKNLTASATEFAGSIDLVKMNIVRYFGQDLSDFDQLQKATTNISSKKY